MPLLPLKFWSNAAMTIAVAASVALAGHVGCGTTDGTTRTPDPGAQRPSGVTGELLRKLPASAEGFVLVSVVDVLAALDGAVAGSSTRVLGALGALGAPWAKDVERIALIGDWSADKRPGAPPAVTCAAAVEHIKTLSGKLAGVEVDEDVFASTRTLFLNMCRKAAAGAPACALRSRQLVDAITCFDSSKPKPAGAVYLIGERLNARDALAYAKRKRPGGTMEGKAYVHGDLAAAVLDPHAVVAGTRGAVLMAIKAWGGQTASLGSSAQFRALLRKVEGKASVVLGVRDLRRLDKDAPDELSASADLRNGVAVKAWANGESRLVQKLETKSKDIGKLLTLTDAALAGMWQEVLKAKPTPAQLQGVRGALRSLVKSFEFRVSAATARLSFEGGTLARTLVLLGGARAGIAAAIQKMRRAKTAEAITQIALIYKGAVAYFQTPRANPKPGFQDQLLPCSFPATVACTPASPPCAKEGDTDNDGRYDAAGPTIWAHESWGDLFFEMRDAHYYQYCFESSGAGGSASFTVTAFGDLDCDGVLSTFRRTGLGVAAAIPGGECSVKGSSAYFSEKPTE